MRVSVIVPLFNKAPYVARALNSIFAQKFGDFEVIVVDDGSTDGGATIVKSYQDPRLILIRQANAGPGAARNAALSRAQGDVVAFLDADDEWMPRYLERAVSLLDENGPNISAVSCGYVDYPQGISRERMWRRRGLHEGVQSVTAETKPSTLVYMLAYMWPCSTVARTAVVRRWGGFYDKDCCKYGEDAMLFLKVLLNQTVYFEMQPWVKFHRESSALSGNYRVARPLEPFLTNPEEVTAVCPPGLQTLLNHFLVLRACKTAAVAGLGGRSDVARMLLKRFVSIRDWHVPFFAPAVIGSTPLAGILGRAFWGLKQVKA